MPFDILFYLSSDVKFNMASPVDGAGGTADLSHTASFPTLLITDTANTPIYEFLVTSQQVQTYAAATPEPETAVLFGAAMFVGVLARRKR